MQANLFKKRIYLHHLWFDTISTCLKALLGFERQGKAVGGGERKVETEKEMKAIVSCYEELPGEASGR